MVEEVYDVSKELVTGVRLRNVKTGEVWDQEVDGFFLAIGHIPNTKVFKGQIETDPDGYILSKGGARTNIPGVFHAGDVQDRTYRQAITAVGRGLHGGHRSRAVPGSGRTLTHDRAHQSSRRPRSARPLLPGGARRRFHLRLRPGAGGPGHRQLVHARHRHETRQVLNNIKAHPGRLRRDHGGRGQAAACFWWTAGDFAAMNEVYAEFFGDAKPARTTVVAGFAVSGIRVEIDAIAYMPR